MRPALLSLSTLFCVIALLKGYDNEGTRNALNPLF